MILPEQAIVARAEGERAAFEGLPITANPYEKDLTNAMWWDKAWKAERHRIESTIDGGIKYFDQSSQFNPLYSFEDATKIWLSLREQMMIEPISDIEKKIYDNTSKYLEIMTAMIGYTESEVSQ